MLPQTRVKLRLFALFSLIVGCALVGLVWMIAKPEEVVKGAHSPTFWETLQAKPAQSDDVQWRLLDLTLNADFFCTLLRSLVAMTVFTSVLSLVVVFNDLRLTKK